MDHIGQFRHLDVILDTQDEGAYAPTEVASPMLDTHMTMLDAGNDQDAVLDSPQVAGVGTASDEIMMRRIRAELASVNAVQQSLSRLNNRVDALESASFSHVPIEEIHDRFEIADYRLLDAEGKIEELEKTKTILENELRLLQDRVSQASQVNADTLERFDGMDQRVLDLEASAPPSARRPWSIEVVLLPWGRALKGIWTADFDSSLYSTPFESSSGSVSNTQSASEGLDLDAQGSDDRLWAKACGPSQSIAGIVFDRLRSRGLIKTVWLKSNNSRHVHDVVATALDDFATASPAALDAPAGLRTCFVPLRKVHKSSRLRFLPSSELGTPEFWSADSLEANIFMKAPRIGLRRLFVTIPAAYFQHDEGVTWQKLRELPRFHDGDEASSVREGDAREACWAWDSRLDPIIDPSLSAVSNPSAHSSFVSHLLSPKSTLHHDLDGDGFDSESESNSSPAPGSPHSDTDDAHALRPTPSPLTPISASSHYNITTHAATAPPALRRTSSLPQTQLPPPLPAFAKRQVASFDTRPSAPPIPLRKRRRLSPRAESFPSTLPLSDLPDTAFDEEAFDNEPLVTSAPPGADTLLLWALTPRRSHSPRSFAAVPDPALAKVELGVGMELGLGLGLAVKPRRSSVENVYATPYSCAQPDFESEGRGGGIDVDVDVGPGPGPGAVAGPGDGTGAVVGGV